MLSRVRIMDEYGTPKEINAIEDKATRELNRIRKSLSFRIGLKITESLRKPWLLPILPINISYLFLKYALERKGNLNNSTDLINKIQYKQRNCVILFPTNGVGMGHFARMHALAKEMKLEDSKLEIIFFTTNYVLHPIYSEGIACYHLPNRNKFDGMKATQWNEICEEMLANVINIHKPFAFIFDGAYPYRGVLNAIKPQNMIERIWIRRQGKSEYDNTPKDAYDIFNRIIIPGDFLPVNSEEMSKWPINEINVGQPIVSSIKTNGNLKQRLGIPENSIVGLVMLGAGVINDVGGLLNQVVKRLLKNGSFVIVGDSMLNPSNFNFKHQNIRFISEYPIMQHRSSFDYAVIAGGYNSVHEVVKYRLPAVIIPNEKTKKDDQIARAEAVSQMGLALTAKSNNPRNIELALERIMVKEVREQVINKIVAYGMINGANNTAKFILGLKK
jgi:spore coat polysaccharide biosynthesis predicted glycosyltransferase SpsG